MGFAGGGQFNAVCGERQLHLRRCGKVCDLRSRVYLGAAVFDRAIDGTDRVSNGRPAFSSEQDGGGDGGRVYLLGYGQRAGFQCVRDGSDRCRWGYMRRTSRELSLCDLTLLLCQRHGAGRWRIPESSGRVGRGDSLHAGRRFAERLHGHEQPQHVCEEHDPYA